MSPEQTRFAQAHDAEPGSHAVLDDRLVFLYHDDEKATYRWLVDEDGRVVDYAEFARASG